MSTKDRVVLMDIPIITLIEGREGVGDVVAGNIKLIGQQKNIVFNQLSNS